MAVLCVFLATACGFDYWKSKVPNQLIIIMSLTGLLIRWKKEGIDGVCSYMGAAFLVGAVLYSFYKIGAIGAGDVKLFGVTAGYLPFGKIFYFLFVSLLIAAIFSIIKLWSKKSMKKRLQNLALYVKRTLESGTPEAYPNPGGEKLTVRLAGPAFLGVLLLLGGAY